MSDSPALDRLLDSLPRLVFVVGKGGVGKTTTAAALARRNAERSARTLLVSTDPAGTLGEALASSLGGDIAPVPGMAELDALQIDAAARRAEFLGQWRDAIVAIIDRGTYLDSADIDGLVDSAFPGADEIFAVLHLAALVRSPSYARIVVDTAPTGHALRLLALPRTFEAMVALLEAMQAKHRFVVRALTHRYRTDEADAFLDEMRAKLAAFRSDLGDPARAAAIVVTRDEPLVHAETTRLISALGELGLAVAARVVNAAHPRSDAADAATTYVVPPLLPPPDGPSGLRRWGDALRLARDPDPGASVPPATTTGATRVGADRAVSAADLEGLLRPLTIVGGKGGVGKSTVACALAIATARRGLRTLLVSTDPAPSVADALAIAVGDEATPVPGVVGLHASQLDAATAFERLRLEYQARVDALFDAFTGQGLDVAHDRTILRDLLALAPPGIDELYATASLAGTLAEDRYARVIVDPAPTGHLLRLIEMPAVVLAWSRQLMRLMLKYKEVAGLGEAAQSLVEYAKMTRALQRLLRDPTRATLIVVALDEPLVRGESARLVRAARERDVAVSAMVWNRVGRVGPAPLPVTPPLTQFCAPACTPPPVGVAALLAWTSDWRALPAVRTE